MASLTSLVVDALFSPHVVRRTPNSALFSLFSPMSFKVLLTKLSTTLFAALIAIALLAPLHTCLAQQVESLCTITIQVAFTMFFMTLHRLQVLWIAAELIATNVVKYFRRFSPVDQLPSNAVDAQSLSENMNYAVATASSALPVPAISLYQELCFDPGRKFLIHGSIVAALTTLLQ